MLILTALDEPEGLSDSLKAGAAGYVLKDAPASRIADAVRRMLAGENPLDEKVAMRLLASLVNGGAGRRTRQSRGKDPPPPAPEIPLGESGESRLPTPSRPERSRS